MSITPYLRGRHFDPDALRIMSAVFVRACYELGLRAGDTAAEGRVAATVIDFVQQGTTGEKALYEAVMQRVKLVRF
jgi:hypothetical protein